MCFVSRKTIIYIQANRQTTSIASNNSCENQYKAHSPPTYPLHVLCLHATQSLYSMLHAILLSNPCIPPCITNRLPCMGQAPIPGLLQRMLYILMRCTLVCKQCLCGNVLLMGEGGCMSQALHLTLHSVVLGRCQPLYWVLGIGWIL